MAADIIQPSVCFPNIFPTVCWSAGAMFGIAGVFSLHKALKGEIDDPVRVSVERRGWCYIFIGVVCVSFTFIQSYLASPEYLCSLRQLYCPRNPAAWDQAPSLWQVIVYFGFVSFSFLSFAEYFFRAARKIQGTSAARVFTNTAAMLITAGVTALAAPALLLMLTGDP